MNPSKVKGSRWESRLRDWFRVNGAPHCERLALSGSADRGDLTGMPGVVIEAKNHKTIDLASWVDELDQEMKNAGAEVGAVMFPRRNRTVDQAYAVMPAAVFARLLRQAGWLA